MESASQASRTRYQTAGRWRRLASVTGPPGGFLAGAECSDPAPAVDVSPAQWVRKDAIGLLEEVGPVDRADAGHVVITDDGMDREASSEIERSEPIRVPGGRIDGVVEVGPDHADVGDVLNVIEGAWSGLERRVEHRIGEADVGPQVLLEVGHEADEDRRGQARTADAILAVLRGPVREGLRLADEEASVRVGDGRDVGYDAHGGRPVHLGHRRRDDARLVRRLSEDAAGPAA